MKRVSLAVALAFLAAPTARASGETFTLRWVTSYQCDEVAREPSVRYGYMHFVSDTEWDVCTDLFLCALGTNSPVHGTRVLHSARRAVFVGTMETNLLYGGPTTIEADLVLDREGEVRSVRGTFIAPAVPGGGLASCASRGRFRTTERID
jgi:hypothetical protein